MAIFGKKGGPAPEGLGEPAPRSSLIGSLTRIQGVLLGDEDVRVEGRVEGRVEVSKAFRVGLEGVVLADVAAATVAIAGRVVGNVCAQERVELLPTGTLEGDIHAPRIVIGEGARFTGRIDMRVRAGSPALSR